MTQHKYKTTTGSGIYQDSSSTADTFVVSAITPDSILLTTPIWEIAQPGFKVNGVLRFNRQRGTTAFNDHLDEISLVFDTSAHTLIVQKHHVSVSSWIMEDWDSFMGSR